MTTGQASAVIVGSLHSAFVAIASNGKCLDYGPPPQVAGTPIVIRPCDRGPSQQLVVEEIDAQHDIILHAGSKLLGFTVIPEIAPPDSADTSTTATATVTLTGAAAPAFITTGAATTVTATTTAAITTSAATAAPATGASVVATASATITGGLSVSDPAQLVLVDADPQSSNAARALAFDGDSLIDAAHREMVVKVQRNRGADGTPVILGRRDLADEELWKLSATDGTTARPTSAFIPVSAGNFATVAATAAPGSVLELDPTASIPITGPIFVAPGITIRGGRRGLTPGAELWTAGAAPNGLLDVRDPNVRITGVRFRGPSSDTDGDGVDARAIVAHTQAANLIVDRCELSSWTTAGVMTQQDDTAISCDVSDLTRPMSVRVVRSYIHNNEKQDAGYGVCVNHGGDALVAGNTFVGNRHAIKAGGEPNTQYRAWNNLVLGFAPKQTVLGVPAFYTQDFDVHGMGDNGFGGLGGQYFQIAQNTFLATDRQNFDLRGTSCRPVDFAGNVSLQDIDDAIACTECGNGLVQIFGAQQFDHGDPTYKLGTGDFDGDGRPDLFLATGAGFYYSAAGKTEWRFLAAHTETIESLRFGDFDGDGRTDVFTVHGNDWRVSWGGASPWDTINTVAVPFGDLAIGNFDDDRRADVFYADGARWLVSSAGTAPWKLFDTSSFRVGDLRFGDFNGDGKTDVFGNANGTWSVTYAGTIDWTPLTSYGTDSSYELVVADFDGDGRADVATSLYLGRSKWSWGIYFTGPRTGLSFGSQPIPLTDAVAIAPVDGVPGADILIWNGEGLEIVAPAPAPPVPLGGNPLR